jgi:hypothetical protein
VFELVPIKQVIPKSVWKPARISKIREAIDKSIPLPPIDLSKKGGRYEITDGIHRFNASVESGFTHIPAILAVYVEAPELKEGKKPELSPGSWVKFNQPQEGFRFGYILEVSWRGNMATTYSVLGVSETGADWVGDIQDLDFESVKRVPRSFKEQAESHWMLKTGSIAQRIAFRYLLN